MVTLRFDWHSHLFFWLWKNYESGKRKEYGREEESWKNKEQMEKILFTVYRVKILCFIQVYIGVSEHNLAPINVNETFRKA